MILTALRETLIYEDMNAIDKKLRTGIFRLVKAQREISRMRGGVDERESELVDEADAHLDTAIDALFELLDMRDAKGNGNE